MNDEWRDKERISIDRKAKGCSVVVISFIAIFVGSYIWGEIANAPKEVLVTRDQYGKEWGFKVSSLTLRCERRKRGPIMRPHVFLIAGNKKYGVNGPAITLGYPESQQLMIRDEHDAFTFKSQLDLIPKGLQLCNWTDEDYRRNRLSTN